MSADCLKSVFRAPSAAFMGEQTRSPVFPAGISSRVRRRLSPDILFPYLPWVYLLTALGAWSTLPIPTLPGWGAASSKLLQVPPPWGMRPWERDPSSRFCPPLQQGRRGDLHDLSRLLPHSKCLSGCCFFCCPSCCCHPLLSIPNPRAELEPAPAGREATNSKNCRKPTQPPLCSLTATMKRIHWGSSLREPPPHNGNKTNIVFLVIPSYAAKQAVSRPSAFSVPVGALLVPFGVVYVWALGAALSQLISCHTNCLLKPPRRFSG